jgi:hypothetical protein
MSEKLHPSLDAPFTKHCYEGFGGGSGYRSGGINNLIYMATNVGHYNWTNMVLRNSNQKAVGHDGMYLSYCDRPQYELLFAAGGQQNDTHTNVIDGLIVARRMVDGVLVKSATAIWNNLTTNWRPTSIEDLRAILKNAKKTSVVYWWRDRFEEFLNELEVTEAGRVPAGTERAVA